MSLMREEVLEAPDAVARCLGRQQPIAGIARRLIEQPPGFAVVCGRGSSSHAGTYLRYLLAKDLGLVAAAAMPSVASIYGGRQRMAGALYVAISQSGRSPDIIRQTELAREAGAFCVAIVNDPASPLAAACDAVIDIAAGPERSVAATKTVLASIAACIALVAAWRDDPALNAALARLPARLRQALPLDWSPLAVALRGIDRLFVAGRGVGLAVAKEAALKLAETAGITGLAFSAAELAHGPMALAGPDFPVLAFLQDDASRNTTEALLATLRERAVPVFAAGGGTLPTLPADHPDLDLLPMLGSFYLVAEQASRDRGRDPDRPAGLAKVTRTT
jgi:glucosamine--fructose-6-phosphate aminotransferase (isomerizing)